MTIGQTMGISTSDGINPKYPGAQSDTTTEDEVLAKWRARYPYLSLGHALELERTDRRFGHLGRQQMVREREVAQEKDRLLRDHLFGVPMPTSTSDVGDEA